MEYIFSIYILITVFLLFIDLKVGVSAFIVYSFLVPVDFPIFVTSTSNVIQLSLLVSLYFYSKKNANKESIKKVIKPFSPLIAMYCLLFVFTFWGDSDLLGFGLGYSFKQWQAQMRNFFIFPIIMWYVAKTDKDAVKWFNRAFIIAGIIVCTYGLFLLFFNSFNPYILYMANLSGKTLGYNMLNESNEFRLMDRYCSVFMHPMNYGLYLSLFVVYVYSIRDRINTLFFYVLIILCIVCLFMSGIRTPIVAIFVGILVYLFFLRRIKTIFTFAIVGLAGLYIISLIPQLKGTIESIFNSNQDLGGSSIDLRVSQFNGCINEISSNPFFGKGYEWTSYYNNVFPGGNHPTMLAFESVVIKVLCNSGIIGFLMFVLSYMKFIKYTSKICLTKDTKALSVTMVASFLVYCLVTGDYNYLILFMPFYSAFIMNHCLITNQENIQ